MVGGIRPMTSPWRWIAAPVPKRSSPVMSVVAAYMRGERTSEKNVVGVRDLGEERCGIVRTGEGMLRFGQAEGERRKMIF
jgi:hypothetical protein